MLFVVSNWSFFMKVKSSGPNSSVTTSTTFVAKWPTTMLIGVTPAARHWRIMRNRRGSPFNSINALG